METNEPSIEESIKNLTDTIFRYGMEELRFKGLASYERDFLRGTKLIVD